MRFQPRCKMKESGLTKDALYTYRIKNGVGPKTPSHASEKTLLRFFGQPARSLVTIIPALLLAFLFRINMAVRICGLCNEFSISQTMWRRRELGYLSQHSDITGQTV